VGQKILLVCGSIFITCAMVEDVVRVVATSFQRLQYTVPAFGPFLLKTLMACRKYVCGMAAL
jgi:hypothetical protein